MIKNSRCEKSKEKILIQLIVPINKNQPWVRLIDKTLNQL